MSSSSSLLSDIITGVSVASSISQLTHMESPEGKEKE